MPVSGEDGLCREHGCNSEGVWEAVQLCCCNKGARHAGFHGQGSHAPAHVCDMSIHVNGAQNVQLPQRIFKSRPLHESITRDVLRRSA